MIDHKIKIYVMGMVKIRIACANLVGLLLPSGCLALQL